MNLIAQQAKQITIAAAVLVVLGCNTNESKETTADTIIYTPPPTDSVPGVINPGAGDTSQVVKPPATNDANVINPDSARLK